MGRLCRGVLKVAVSHHCSLPKTHTLADPLLLSRPLRLHGGRHLEGCNANVFPTRSAGQLGPARAALLAGVGGAAGGEGPDGIPEEDLLSVAALESHRHNVRRALQLQPHLLHFT